MFGGDDGSEYIYPATLPPGPVQDLSAQQTSATTALAAWKPPVDTGGGISGYTVRWLQAGSTLWHTEAATESTSATIAGLSATHTYTVKVSCTSSTDVLSSPAGVNLTIFKLASAPRGVKATAEVKALAVSWLSPANLGGSPLKGYVLTATWSGGEKTHTVGATDAATVTGLPSGKVVHVQVQAITSAGDGAKSAVASATPKP